ncbi:MAG TPA: hypothetical protein VHQ47_20685 [Phycisphaerae bacterium]|nr:hypothetical protein [Phycisphaerae bacterium]HVX84144.1 hypothetical protein [Phycisphaerae bacterium]
MNPETLNSLLKREPFIPLRLTLTTGETLDIADPTPVFIENLAVHIFGVKRAGDHLAEWARIISLRHIVKIDQMAASAA